MTSYPAPVSRGLSIRNPAGNGMADLLRHRFSYQAGFIYVGNGTLGANDSIYFSPSAQTTTITPFVPIAPADATLGQAYIADLWKHYARKVYHGVRLFVVPIAASNSTATGVDIVIAPFRGGSIVPIAKADTTAANATSSVIGMSGSRQFSAWLGCDMDLTAYIAGGSGAKQNEFNIANDTAQTSGSETIADQSWTTPCAFAVAGDATTTTYRGVFVARVYVEVIVSLLDFIGGFAATNPTLVRAKRARESVLERDVGYEKCGERTGCARTNEAAALQPYVMIEQPDGPLIAPTPSEMRQLALNRQSAATVPLTRGVPAANCKVG